MNINDIKLVIEKTTLMLDDLKTEQIITGQEKISLLPVVVESVLKNNYYKNEYEAE